MDLFEQLSGPVRPAGCGPEWQVYELNCNRDVCPEGFVRLTGCDTVGRYTKGPRKGDPKFKGFKNKRTVFITMQRYREIIAAI